MLDMSFLLLGLGRAVMSRSVQDDRRKCRRPQNVLCGFIPWRHDHSASVKVQNHEKLLVLDVLQLDGCSS